jgi:hypothetical protein
VIRAWTFALGDPSEGLNTPLDRLPAHREPVSLPHRLLAPDTPFWYVAEARLSQPCVLKIRADDGAQVYLNETRIPMRDGVFVLPAVSEPARLTVRVLNKAMYGGLQEVQTIPLEDYLQEREAEKRAQREAAGSPDTPALLVGPYLQEPNSRGVTVVWETDAPCETFVEWGKERVQERRAAAQSDGCLHCARLEGLPPGSGGVYQVRYGKRTSEERRFQTLPDSGAFSFGVIADSQNRWETLRLLIERLRSRSPAFVAAVGDMVEEGDRQIHWQSLLKTLRPLASEIPVILIGGNHEYDGCFETMRSPWLERYARHRTGERYAAWSCGHARFIALDPNLHYPTGVPLDSEQYRWFLRELQSPAWSRAVWRFVLIHQPPYSQGWFEYHGDLPIREMLAPLIEPCGIDVVLSGHTHDYERLTLRFGKQTTHFFVVGGGGGGLEEGPLSETPVMDRVIRRHHVGIFHLDNASLIFEAAAPDGEIIDRLEATKSE